MLEKAEVRGLQLKKDWRNAHTPDPSGSLHNSRTGGWRLWRPDLRRIPRGSLVHWSVVARMNNQSLGYKPENLPSKDQYRQVERQPDAH